MMSEREFATLMAQGECLCDEIDESDRPCLTCSGQEHLAALDAAPEETR
jgi:hypothetical protein